MNIITDFTFNLDRNLVFKAIDCFEDSEVYEEVCETYETLSKDLQGMISAKAMFQFREKPEEYTMEDVKSCSHIVFCLVTLGEKVTKATESYFSSGLYLEGMLLDAMSDVILAEYAAQLYNKVAEEARRRGVGLSCKLSPGNADFHISNQKDIIDRVNGREVLNIDVTEGFMLRPVKSVSFIFGADKKLDIPLSDHECSRCTSTTCKMRKEPYAEKKTKEFVNLTVATSGEKRIIKASKEKSILDILIENRIKISTPCSGNGTCGKCRVKILEGKVNRLKNNSRLDEALIKEGWTLACSTFLEEDCSINVVGEENGFNILEAFEARNIEVNPICKLVKVELDKKNLKGRGITEVINEKLKKNYMFSLRALKALGTLINSYGSDGESISLYKEDAVELLVNDNTVMNVCKANSERLYGIAVDIGTTTIALGLLDLVSGKIIKSHSLLNSQRQFGSDVISRIQNSNEGKLNLLKECIKSDLLSGIKDICTLANIKTDEIYHIAVAGNTTMLYFLLGLPCESLALFPFNTITTSMLEYSFQDIFQDRMIDCGVTLLPGISAYVGADIVSGMLQCGFNNLEKTSILIDVGTNGEMSIGNKEKMLCLATAAGPAFEGANISCGTGSIKGAICSVTIKNGQVAYETIGNGEPKGICGSAVIDIIAECIKNSIIDETGRFDEEQYEEGYVKLTDNITFDQKDIREVQLAKSAIRSGIEILLQEFKCEYKDIDTVFLAGGFGNHMNIENAAVIGLIPEELKSKVKTVGNSSLGGAVSFLLNEESREALSYILGRTEYIDISSNKSFNDLFINNMLF